MERRGPMDQPITVGEVTFKSKESLLTFYDRRVVDHIVVNGKALTLPDLLHLSVDGTTLPITRIGIDSLLRELRIPQNYAYDVCDSNLLLSSVNYLLTQKEGTLSLKIMDDRVTFIARDFQGLIDDKLVVDAIADELVSFHIAQKSDGILRINFTNEHEEEILPGDPVRAGYEVLNYEFKPAGLSASLFLLRMVCSNGQVSSEPVERFSSSNGRSSVSEILEHLRSRITHYQDAIDYYSAFRFAAERIIDTHYNPLRDFIKKHVNKNFLEDNFADISEKSTWLEVVNRITNAAKLHPLTRRRDLELLAGSLLESFFHGEDFGQYIFRKHACPTCPHIL